MLLGSNGVTMRIALSSGSTPVGPCTSVPQQLVSVGAVTKLCNDIMARI